MQSDTSLSGVSTSFEGMEHGPTSTEFSQSSFSHSTRMTNPSDEIAGFQTSNNNNGDTNDIYGNTSYENKVLLHNTNRMLSLIGINAKKILSVDELKRVASSMVVAIYESLFNERIPGIIRFPQALVDYEINAQLVIDGLCERIHMDLHHITGVAITEGDLTAISNVISIFIRIANITGRKEANGTSYRSNGVKQDKSYVVFGQDIGTSLNLSLSFDNVAQIIKSNERRMSQVEKLEAARNRREMLKELKSSQYQTLNREKFSKSRDIKVKNQQDDFVRNNKAISVRTANQEYVILRKVYAQLLKKLHSWQLEDKALKKEVEAAANKEIYDYVKALQNDFDTRVSLLKEEAEAQSKADLNSSFQTRKYNSMLKDVIKQEYQKLFQKLKASTVLKKQLRNMTRMQGYENMLAMISTGNDWSNSLRGGNHVFD